MVTLALGIGADEFYGWGGVGPSVNLGVVNGPGHGVWTHSNINMAVTTLNASGFGRGCLWLPFTKQADTLSILINMEWSSTAAFTPDASTLSLVLMGLYGDGNSAIVIAANGVANTYDVFLATDYTDWDTYTALGIAISPVNVWSYACLTITGGGTPNGSIDFSWGPSTPQYESVINAETSWTGDLTGFKNFSAISFHNPFTGTSPYLFGGVAVDTVSLKGGGVWTYIPNTIGTLNEWVNTGWTTAFAEFPTVAATYTNGLYGTAASQRVTFKAAGALSTAMPAGYGVLAVAVHAVTITPDSQTDATVVPITYDPTDATVTQLGDPLPVPARGSEIQVLRWYLENDKNTGTMWDIANIARYQFGLERVS